MSTKIATGENLENEWRLVQDGDGASAFSFSGKKATFSASAGNGNRAYALKSIPAGAGEKITVKILARKISGTPTITMDYPNTGSAVTQVEIVDTNWREYELSFTMPHYADQETQTISIAAGVLIADAGEVELANPAIFTEWGGNGFARVHSSGLIRMTRTAGVTSPTINKSYYSYGIDEGAMTYNATTKELTVQTQGRKSGTDLAIEPLFFTQITTDRLSTVFAKVGSYSEVDGTVIIKFADNTGYLDVNTLLNDGESFFVSILGLGG